MVRVKVVREVVIELVRSSILDVWRVLTVWHRGSCSSKPVSEHECGWEEQGVTDRRECGNKRKRRPVTWDIPG